MPLGSCWWNRQVKQLKDGSRKRMSLKPGFESRESQFNAAGGNEFQVTATKSLPCIIFRRAGLAIPHTDTRL